MCLEPILNVSVYTVCITVGHIPSLNVLAFVCEVVDSDHRVFHHFAANGATVSAWNLKCGAHMC
jgi:hypothetical protein